VSPVRAELKLHGNSRDYPHDEADPKNSSPELRGLIVEIIPGAQSHGFEDYDERSQSHGELWKQIVKSDSKSKLDPVEQNRAVHMSLICERSEFWMV